MNAYKTLLAEYADAQFDGASFDGPSLMKTLESLGPEAAASTETHEGYSAWEVALHVLFYKRFILEKIRGEGSLGPYPYPRANFTAPPKVDADEWKLLHGRMRDTHRAVMDAIRDLPEERLPEIIPEWKTELGKAVAWLCGHDGYHAAQIRNMGVPGLRKPRED